MELAEGLATVDVQRPRLDPARCRRTDRHGAVRRQRMRCFISARILPARTAGSVSKRSNRGVFPLTILLEPVRTVLASDIRWNLMMDLMIPDKTLSINRRSDCSNGMAVLPRQREALHGQFWMHWRRNIISAWIHRSAIFRRMCMHVLIYGTDGKEVKVHYKGQRGEGVYDVAFEGLIRNVERRYQRDFFREQQGRV